MSHWANTHTEVELAVAELKELVARTGDDQPYEAGIVWELDRASQICIAAAVYLKHTSALLSNAVTPDVFKTNLSLELLSLEDPMRDIVRPPISYSNTPGKQDGEMDPSVLGNTAPS